MVVFPFCLLLCFSKQCDRRELCTESSKRLVKVVALSISDNIFKASGAYVHPKVVSVLELPLFTGWRVKLKKFNSNKLRCFIRSKIKWKPFINKIYKKVISISDNI